uniref:Uncharacterized protein n=1 Tax=Anopheles maculatus TaxID=74869 RepID=A0A182T300_9DIPT
MFSPLFCAFEQKICSSNNFISFCFRWSANNKHKPVNVNESQAKTHRKSSVPYFVPPSHLSAGQQPSSVCASQQAPHSLLPGASSQLMTAHQYFHHANNAGSGSANSGSTANYNKSSSYPSFASTLHNGGGVNGNSGGGGGGGGGGVMKPMAGINPSMQPTNPHHQQLSHKPTTQQPPSLQPPAMQHPNFMFHRHSLSNITHHHHNANPLVPPPAIFLNNLCSVTGENRSTGAKIVDNGPVKANGGGMMGPAAEQPLLMAKDCGGQSESGSSSNNSNHNSSIVDINSRLEFLCRQMTEQAIN